MLQEKFTINQSLPENTETHLSDFVIAFINKLQFTQC